MNYYIGVLKKYAVFKGRSKRSEYWYFFLFNAIISVFLAIIGKLINNTIIGNLYSLIIFLPSLAVAVRRLHDIGKNGWFVLLSYIPILGILSLLMFPKDLNTINLVLVGLITLISLTVYIWFIILMTRDSNFGENKYGPNPKEMTPSIPVVSPSIPQPTSIPEPTQTE